MKMTFRYQPDVGARFKFIKHVTKYILIILASVTKLSMFEIFSLSAKIR